jgi:hypothetical protein
MGKVEGHIPLTIPSDVMTKINGNELGLLLFGALEYDDMLKKTERYVSGFAFLFAFSGEIHDRKCTWIVYPNHAYWQYS